MIQLQIKQHGDADWSVLNTKAYPAGSHHIAVQERRAAEASIVGVRPLTLVVFHVS